MKHFLYVMKSEDPAPAGGGDTRSWFYYYKLNAGPDVFVPFPEHVGTSPAAGDTLWLIMNNRIVGFTPITRVSADPINDRVEVFYDSDHVLAPTGQAAVAGLLRSPVTGEVNLLECHLLDALLPPQQDQLGS